MSVGFDLDISSLEALDFDPSLACEFNRPLGSFCEYEADAEWQMRMLCCGETLLLCGHHGSLAQSMWSTRQGDYEHALRGGGCGNTIPDVQFTRLGT